MRSKWGWLPAIPLLLLCVPYLAGIAYLLPVSLRGTIGSEYMAILSRPDILATVRNTAWISFLVAICCLPIGLVLGLFVARRKRHKGIWLALVLLPWVVSVVVRSYGWTVLLSNRGVVNTALVSVGLSPIPLMFQISGVVIGLVHVYAPYVVLTVLSAAMHQDSALEEAAAVLGARPFYSFRHVTFPLVLPGLLFGGVLVFLLSCGSVVTPLMLGGIRARMIGTQIYQDIFQLFDLPKAAAMSLMLMALTLAAAGLLLGARALLTRRTEPVA